MACAAHPGGGGAGQLASAPHAAAAVRLHRVGRPAFDFDRSESLTEIMAATVPWLVVNAAAYTAVMRRRLTRTALRANRDGPAELAHLCAQAGIPLKEGGDAWLDRSGHARTHRAYQPDQA